MEPSIVFCSDGHLRVMLGEKQPLVPLVAFRDMGNFKDDFAFMSKWWNDNVIFENGTTIGSFLDCLNPWRDFWKTFTGKDVGAYIDESKKPSLVTDDKKWWVSLTYVTELDVKTKSQKNYDDFENINDYFNDKTPPLLEPFWNLSSHYKLTGYNEGEEEHYGIDHRPINELVNCPLYLSPYNRIDLSNSSYERYGDPTEALINLNGFGVRKIENIFGGSNTWHYILGDKEHTLKDVVEAFFWWFATNPQKRDDMNEYLHSVIPPLEDNEDNIEETDEMKIVVADGAFDGIKQYHDAQKDHFEKALEYAKTGNIPIKIGQVVSQPAIENRVFSKILND